MRTDGTFLEVTVHVASVWTPSVACCCVLLGVVAQSWKWFKVWSQQLPTFLLFHDCQSIVQQCCIHLHPTANTDKTTPNVVGPNSLITFKARFWQTCWRIMLYWIFRKVKPLLFKIIIILLIIIIYKINISMFYLFQILSSLLVSPYFFLDVLYVHELPSELNLCKVSSIRLMLILSMNVTVKFSKQVF